MDRTDTLTDQIRGWYERSPKAQRAYQRISADLDTVAEQVESVASGLIERITPYIDPPAKADTPAQMPPAEEASPESAPPAAGTSTGSGV